MRINERAAKRTARVNLEMGGKDAFIVCADVAEEIEIAARGGAWAAFLNAGQVCTSAERFYVDKRVYEPFLEAFVEHTRTLRLGDPMDPATDIGPMASAVQRDKVRAQLDGAVAAGATLVVGGDDGGFDRGHFLSPAVVTGAAARDRPAARGDVRPGRADRPRRLARRGDRASPTTSRSASAPTSTRATSQTAIRCARELKAGTVWINDPLTDNDAGPFGGYKSLGLGRELGREGLEAFQETKHVHIETKLEIKDWWYPYGA